MFFIMLENIDIIECLIYSDFSMFKEFIENKFIKCNILISHTKTRYYYNGKHYYNKTRYVS